MPIPAQAMGFAGNKNISKCIDLGNNTIANPLTGDLTSPPRYSQDLACWRPFSA
jgi:hypothetical protein